MHVVHVNLKCAPIILKSRFSQFPCISRWEYWPDVRYMDSATDTIYLSNIMRKPEFCMCENKDTDQLCSNCTADQCLCFATQIAKFLCFKIQNFKLLAYFFDCTGRSVSDLLCFSRDAAQLSTINVCSYVCVFDVVKGNENW